MEMPAPGLAPAPRSSFGDRVRWLWHEGLVRHVVVQKDGHRPIDLPLTAIIVGGVLAPWLLAIGVVVAVITGYKMETERHEEHPPAPPETPAAEAPAEQPPSGA
jgi:hypothetical protein